MSAERLTLNFDPDWRFIKSDPVGAAAVNFNDAGWASVSLPHTYNDTDTFDDFSLPGHRGEQNQWGGRTWHRKTFSLPENFKGKKVYLEFAAARQVAEVYLNSKLLGVSKTGFIPFGFDLNGADAQRNFAGVRRLVARAQRENDVIQIRIIRFPQLRIFDVTGQI